MPRNRTYSTEAIVLRQTALGEADRVLTLFTPDLGKLGAVAKGVRRPVSRTGGHLELLNRVRVTLAQGRTLDVVTDAQATQSFAGLRSRLQSISRAMYAAELVDRFCIDRSPNIPGLPAAAAGADASGRRAGCAGVAAPLRADAPGTFRLSARVVLVCRVPR